MIPKVTEEQKKEILAIKKQAKYRDAPEAIDKRKGRIRRRFKRQRKDILAKAWMKYIDYLGIDTYRAKHFNYKTYGKRQGACKYKDDLFTTGERAAITQYLLEHDLIGVNAWSDYVVKWRDEYGKEEKKKETAQQTTDEDHQEEQPLARL